MGKLLNLPQYRRLKIRFVLDLVPLLLVILMVPGLPSVFVISTLASRAKWDTVHDVTENRRDKTSVNAQVKCDYKKKSRESMIYAWTTSAAIAIISASHGKVSFI